MIGEGGCKLIMTIAERIKPGRHLFQQQR